MIDTPKHITIQVDEEALRSQVQDAVDGSLRAAAMQLRYAADTLDGGAGMKALEEHHQRQLDLAYERGVKTGREQRGEDA